MCESDADGSFLHENWNKDLRLFSDGEDGGQQLLQVFDSVLLVPLIHAYVFDVTSTPIFTL